MPTMNLTKTSIARLPAPDPSGHRKFYWDRKMYGFGVVVSGTTNKKNYVVQRDLPGGKTRRKKIGPVDDDVMDLKKARKLAGTALGVMHAGIDLKKEAREREAEDYTLQQAFDTYVAAQQKRKKMKQRTADEYERLIKSYLGDWLDLPLMELDTNMVLVRHEKIQADVANRKITNLAKGHSTANGTMRVLRATYNDAEARYPQLPKNPVKTLGKRMFPERKRTRHLEYQEDEHGNVLKNDLKTFYKALINPKVVPNAMQRACLELILFTGMRSAEARLLRWDTEVDLDMKLIHLPPERTKAKRDFVLPMSDHLRSLLVKQRQLVRGGPFVFPASSKTGTISELRHPLGLIADATGIAIRPHDLRRTFITVAESCEISPYALKGLANHAGGQDITADYIQLTATRMREPAQKVCNQLKVLCGIDQTKAENVVEL